MSNREKRERLGSVHVLLALQRSGTNKNHRCLRQVIRDHDADMRFLEMRCLAYGGEWRIHHTVNARDTEKAMRYLMKKLIDHPELGSDIDMEWRSALLQPECIFGEKRFMLDIDRKDTKDIDFVLMQGEYKSPVLERHESPKGWHYITKPFDTREVCALTDVTLQRDGYFYLKTIGG